MSNCHICTLLPCVCSYLAKLEDGQPFAWLRETAVAMSQEPLPHRNGEGSCPCPICVSDRSKAWDAWAAAQSTRKVDAR